VVGIQTLVDAEIWEHGIVTGMNALEVTAPTGLAISTAIRVPIPFTDLDMGAGKSWRRGQQLLRARRTDICCPISQIDDDETIFEIASSMLYSEIHSTNRCLTTTDSKDEMSCVRGYVLGGGSKLPQRGWRNLNHSGRSPQAKRHPALATAIINLRRAYTIISSGIVSPRLMYICRLGASAVLHIGGESITMELFPPPITGAFSRWRM
jgi:hypothetical protein